MQITFSGPDGQLLTVDDPRRNPLPPKQAKKISIALPRERRPASWMLATFKV